MKARIKELTPRKRPGSIEKIAAELNRTLIGWFNYFRHCRWTIFKALDGKIRARLRRLLLRRHRKNPKRLPRTKRWPNAYFTKAGLYSLREAHFRFAQSKCNVTTVESRCELLKTRTSCAGCQNTVACRLVVQNVLNSPKVKPVGRRQRRPNLPGRILEVSCGGCQNTVACRLVVKLAEG